MWSERERGGQEELEENALSSRLPRFVKIKLIKKKASMYSQSETEFCVCGVSSDWGANREYSSLNPLLFLDSPMRNARDLAPITEFLLLLLLYTRV